MKTLCKSEHYLIGIDYEKVLLTIKGTGRKVVIGDFYGDADGGFIDAEEKYAVMFGCGVIVYYLTEPFEEYRYDTVCAQWKEHGRDGDKWVNAVTPVCDGRLLIEYDDGNAVCIKL